VTVVIPLYDAVVSLERSNGAEFGSWFSEIAQTLDAITRSQFRAGRRWTIQRGLFARSASAVAPACDKEGSGDLRSLDSRLLVRVIFRFYVYLAC
jgi:hypothetical protein